MVAQADRVAGLTNPHRDDLIFGQHVAYGRKTPDRLQHLTGKSIDLPTTQVARKTAAAATPPAMKPFS